VERSSDGLNLQPIALLGSHSQSFTNTGLSSSTRYWYRVFASNAAGNSPYSNVADVTTTSSGPPPYEGPRGDDVGAVAVPGHHGSNKDLVSISGSGEDIYRTADEFYFFHFPASGDFEMVVRAQPSEMDNTNPWAKAGIMARETLAANSRNFFVFRTPSADTGVQSRSVVGGNTSKTSGGSGAGPSAFWLKVVRIGNTFSGYRSADGQNWTLMASTTMVLSSSLRVGLAVTSHNDGVLCDAVFTRVEGPQPVGGSGGGGTFAPASPTDLRAANISSNSLTLAWTDRVSDESSYRVERSQDGVALTVVATLGSNSSTFTNTGLTPATHYWYRGPWKAPAPLTSPSNPTAARPVVTWAVYGKNGFMGKLVSLFMDCDKMCGPQFEKGLADSGTVAGASAASVSARELMRVSSTRAV
jgi:hypothetical protein